MLHTGIRYVAVSLCRTLFKIVLILGFPWNENRRMTEEISVRISVYFYRTQVSLGSDLWVLMSVSQCKTILRLN